MTQRATEEVSSAAVNETGQYIAIALLAVGLIGVVPYLILPVLLVGKFCPATTFASGPMASIFLSICGLVLSMFSYMYLATGLWPKAEAKPRFKYPILDIFVDNHRHLFLTSTICGLGLGGFVWINTFESYYCLTPQDIFLHPSALSKARSLNWNDIEIVQAQCWHTKSGPVGGLVMSFRDGERIRMSLSQGQGSHAQEYMAIRKALKDQSYSYVTDLSVAPSECPSNVYPWLAGQLGRRE